MVEGQCNELEEQRRDSAQLIDFYEQRLGIHFLSQGGAVRCEFRFIDPHAPQRKFSFLLLLTESGEYAIRDPSPALPEKALRTLEVEANQSSQLLPLFCGCRTLFRRSLCA